VDLLTLSKITSLWSFRRELLWVSLAFLLTLSLPVIAVFLLTNLGISFVSDSLAKLNETTHIITLFYPNGTVFKEITLTTKWPVDGVITCEFGQIDLPYTIFHTGIDIANREGKTGDPITAFMPGEVIFAGEQSGGLGKYVVIDNGDYITSFYGHLSQILVVKGEEVASTSQVIGLEGESGSATGPHLHFQTDVFGIPVNPRIFLGSGNPK